MLMYLLQTVSEYDEEAPLTQTLSESEPEVIVASLAPGYLT